MSVVLDTAGRSAADRVAFWNDVVGETFVPSHVTPVRPGPFRARVAVSRLGAVALCTVDADAERVDRTRSMVARSERETLMVGLLDRGGRARVAQNGREAVVGPGELVLYDSRRPFALEFDERFRLQVFVVPHHCVGLRDDEITAAVGLTVPASGTAALVAPLLRRLAEDAALYPPDLLPGVGQAAADLVTLALRERLGAPAAPGGTAVIAAFVERHLEDPDLGPRSIARAHGVSVRSLHKLFESEDTTVARFVQERRLERARRALCVPESAYRGIAVIAHRSGFRSAAHFSRSFRATFGTSPTAYRAARLAGAVSPELPGGPAGPGPAPTGP